MSMLGLYTPPEAMSFITSAAKVAAVAVRTDAGRQGLGTALVHACCATYFAAGYSLVHGTYRLTDGEFLPQFYQRAGFELPQRKLEVLLSSGRILAFGSGHEGDQKAFAMTREQWNQSSR